MRRDNAGAAINARDDGLRKVSRLTWQIGAAGVVCSALIAAAFGHGVTATHPATHPATSQPGQGGQGGQGGIVIPAQPPAAAEGAGQVNSGAS